MMGVLGDIYDSEMIMELKKQTDYNGSILLSVGLEIKYETLKIIISQRLQE